MQRDLDYRVVIDTTPTLIFSALPDGYVDYANRACLEYFGASFQDLEGSAWTKFVHPDDLQERSGHGLEMIEEARCEPAPSNRIVTRATEVPRSSD